MSSSIQIHEENFTTELSELNNLNGTWPTISMESRMSELSITVHFQSNDRLREWAQEIIRQCDELDNQ